MHLNGKSDLFDKVKLAAEVKNELQPVVNWGKKWLLNFNTSKTKLLSFK